MLHFIQLCLPDAVMMKYSMTGCFSNKVRFANAYKLQCCLRIFMTTTKWWHTIYLAPDTLVAHFTDALLLAISQYILIIRGNSDSTWSDCKNSKFDQCL